MEKNVLEEKVLKENVLKKCFEGMLKHKKTTLIALIAVILIITATLFIAFRKTPYKEFVKLNKMLMTQEELAAKLDSFDGDKEAKYKYADKYVTKLEKRLEYLGLRWFLMDDASDVNARLKLRKKDVEKFIKNYSMEELFLMVEKYKYMDSRLSAIEYGKEEITTPRCYFVFIKWAMELYPEEVFNPYKLEENTSSGYYAEHPDAMPYARVEPVYDSNEHYNTYTVKYCGDFAIQYSEIYEYDEGKLGWYDGVFYDEKGGYYVAYEEDIYYKGEHLIWVYRYCSKFNGANKNEKDDWRVYVSESGKVFSVIELESGDIHVKCDSKWSS